jgi:acyl carrier protein
MSNREDIKNAVRAFILEEFLRDESPGSFQDSAELMTTGLLNSLGALQLVTFLEDTFAIKIAAREVSVDHMNTLDDIVDLVVSKKRG